MTMTQVGEEVRRAVVGADCSPLSRQALPQRRVALTMDLPSLCPLCDSALVNFTYLPGDDADIGGRLVFRCADCSTYVEALISDFDPPVTDPSPACSNPVALAAEPTSWPLNS